MKETKRENLSKRKRHKSNYSKDDNHLGRRCFLSSRGFPLPFGRRFCVELIILIACRGMSWHVVTMPRLARDAWMNSTLNH